MSLKAGNYYGTLELCEVVQVGERKVDAFEMKWQINFVWDGAAWTKSDELPTPRHIRFFLTDAAWPHSEDKLRTLGFNGDFSSPRLSEELYTQGRALNCTINAKGYEDWEIAGLVGVNSDPAPADKLRLLNAKWKAKNRPTSESAPVASAPAQTTQSALGAPEQAAVTPQSAPPPALGEDPPDDGIPF